MTELRYAGAPQPVRFLERPNRFLAKVTPGTGPPFLAHVRNPGRMEELLVPGETRGYVVPEAGRDRSTAWTLVAVRHGRALVSIDTWVANRIVQRVLSETPPTGYLPGGWSAEVPVGSHRLDFVRRDPEGRRPELWLEVKSSNLRVGRVAMFPDAPTRRGTEHLRLLASARRRGRDARVLIVIQRDDITAFAPNRVLDPEFGRAFDVARAAGVRIDAYTLRVTPGGVRWGRRVPVRSGARA